MRRQTYADWECLCIIDGSKDSSASIVSEFVKQDRRFILIEKENEGVAATRNYGIEHATGEYLTFMDQDDVMHTRFLEMALSAIERANADVLSVGIKTIYDNRIDASAAVPECGPRVSDDVLGDWIKAIPTKGFTNINVWGKLYRRDSLMAVRFPNGVFGADDFVFTLRMMLKGGKWVSLDDAELYIYRMSSENITSKMPAQYVYGVLKAAQIIHAEIQGSAKPTKKQLNIYYKNDSKRLLSWAIKKSVRCRYAPEEIEKIRSLLRETRRVGALRFYSIRDRLKYELFVRGRMGLLVRSFPKLKAKKD